MKIVRVEKQKKYKFDQLTEKAIAIFKEVLSSFILPDNFSTEETFMEVGFENEVRIFDLYLSGNTDNPSDDFLLVRVKLDVFMNDRGIETSLLKKSD